MSQLSKREEVWLEIYCSLINSRGQTVAMSTDARSADVGLEEFYRRFPAFLKLDIPENEYEDIKKAFNAPGYGIKGFTLTEDQGRLRDIARNITSFLVEKEEKEILEMVGKFSTDALARLRNAINTVIENIPRKDIDK